MAQAIVTLKVTPNELQIIDEALRMYAQACRDISRNNLAYPLEGYKLDLSISQNCNHRRLAARAEEIKRGIGLAGR